MRWPGTIDCRCRSNGPAPSCCSASCNVVNAKRTFPAQLCARPCKPSRRWAHHCGPSAHEATHTHVLALTPSELRLAELAASSMTNRDVGAALFISPKTIEGCSSARRRSKQTSHGFTASSASRRGPNWAAASTAANTCGYSACCGGTRANAAKRYRIRGAPRAKSPAGLANLRTCRSQGLYTPANREVT